MAKPSPSYLCRYLKRDKKSSTSPKQAEYCPKPRKDLKFPKVCNKVLSLPLFVKLVAVNILLVAFPLFFIVMITNRQITTLNQEEFSKYSAETVHQASKSISVIFNELNLLSNIVISDQNLQQALSYPEEGQDVEKIESYNQVNSSLNVLFNSRMGYTSLVIYGYNGQLFYRGFSSADYYFDFDNYLSDIKTKTYLGSHYRNYATDNKLVFSLAMPIKSTSDFSTLGYMIVDLDYSYFDALMNDINYSDNSDIMIVNRDQILYSKYEEKIHDPLDAEFLKLLYSEPTGSGFFYNGDETNFYSFCPIADTDWKVVSVHSLSSYTNKSTTIFNFMLMEALVSLAVSIVILVMISSAITRPLNKLTSLMEQVQRGNFNVRFYSKYRDEVGKLGTSFNYMLTYTNTLIDNVYKLQIAEKEATIFALQSQINPHFLYNTLQMISDFAETGDAEEVSSVCSCLSSIFRYSIDGKNRYVRFSDEVAHVKNYVYIQSIRLNHRFEFSLQIPEECYNVRVPRLILQPLVENCITHGIYDKLEGGKIIISASLENGLLHLKIADNGVGIPEEKLAFLRETLNPEHHSEEFGPESIGIGNVNRRLILSYGPEYRLTIESALGRGTVITIWIPSQTDPKSSA